MAFRPSHLRTFACPGPSSHSAFHKVTAQPSGLDLTSSVKTLQPLYLILLPLHAILGLPNLPTGVIIFFSWNLRSFKISPGFLSPSRMSALQGQIPESAVFSAPHKSALNQYSLKQREKQAVHTRVSHRCTGQVDMNPRLLWAHVSSRHRVAPAQPGELGWNGWPLPFQAPSVLCNAGGWGTGTAVWKALGHPRKEEGWGSRGSVGRGSWLAGRGLQELVGSTGKPDRQKEKNL